jgi:hypothetical protein
MGFPAMLMLAFGKNDNLKLRAKAGYAFCSSLG